MKISLRPHHFLCLQGYKGLNYSKSNTKSWNNICDLLKQTPDTDVVIIKGSDDLCSNCPAIKNNKKARCITETVNKLDNKVKRILNIKTGEQYKYREIAEKLSQIMTKEKHEKLCQDCAWWKKGLCKDSFNK